MNNIKLYLSILLTAFLGVAFISIFFFTYGKNVEKNIIINNLNYLVGDLMDGIDLLSDDTTNKLLDIVNNIKLDNMNEKDKEVEELNNKLFNKALLWIGLPVTIVIVVTYVTLKLTNYSNEDIMEVYVRGLLLMCCVALIEYIFLVAIAKSYISIDSNTIKKELIVKIKEKMPKIDMKYGIARDKVLSIIENKISNYYDNAVKIDETVTSIQDRIKRYEDSITPFSLKNGTRI